jgi:hypothetical protein
MKDEELLRAKSVLQGESNASSVRECEAARGRPHAEWYSHPITVRACAEMHSCLDILDFDVETTPLHQFNALLMKASSSPLRVRTAMAQSPAAG